MTAYKLKKVLEHIAKYAKPYREISPFYVEYVAKECTTVNAKYNMIKKKILIYNFSRPTTNILCSALHELAHHICVEESNNKTHDTEFYRTFKDLLSAATEIGYIDYEECRKIDDSNTVKMMEKKVGKIYAIYNENNDPNKNICTIQVVGGFQIKDYLVQQRFHYSPLERTWEKDLSWDKARKIEHEIKNMDQSINVILSAVTDLSIQVFYCALVKGNTYQHREILKKQGYQYKDGCWKKRFEASGFQDEYLFLKTLKGIEYKIS